MRRARLLQRSKYGLLWPRYNPSSHQYNRSNKAGLERETNRKAQFSLIRTEVELAGQRTTSNCVGQWTIPLFLDALLNPSNDINGQRPWQESTNKMKWEIDNGAHQIRFHQWRNPILVFCVGRASRIFGEYGAYKRYPQIFDLMNKPQTSPTHRLPTALIRTHLIVKRTALQNINKQILFCTAISLNRIWSYQPVHFDA